MARFDPGAISAEDLPALVRRLNVILPRLTAVLDANEAATAARLNQVAGVAMAFGGDAGVDGDPGPPGSGGGGAGTPGADGATGAQGPMGPALSFLAQDGEEGERGSPGPAGAAGAAGATGSTGAQGPAGPALYFLAEDGEPGEIGPMGRTGATGPAGSGATGAQGPMGPALAFLADDGEDGERGPPGTSGAAGTDAIVYVPTTSDFDISEITDVTIVTRDVTGVVAGDQLMVEAHFTILNNSAATRVCVITLDFDGLFDVEFSTGALVASATLMHPFFVRGVLDVRSTSLCYGVFTAEGQLAAGIASGTDTTMAATHLRGMGWDTSTSDVTGTTTVALKVRSANANPTQTLRLHQFSIRKVTPT